MKVLFLIIIDNFLYINDYHLFYELNLYLLFYLINQMINLKKINDFLYKSFEFLLVKIFIFLIFPKLF